MTVVGGGIAGCEAAWQVARRGHAVRLFEMRPVRPTEGHSSGTLGELVGSNSLRSSDLTRAVGLLQEELRRLGSIVLAVASECRVPGGRLLAVDRARFARTLEDRIRTNPRIEVVRAEVSRLPEPPALIATGRFTSPAMQEILAAACGGLRHRYHATSPIVVAESLRRSLVCRSGSPGEAAEAAFLPLDRKEYRGLLEELVRAEVVPIRGSDVADYEESGLPIERLAQRAPERLVLGALRPSGVVDPRGGDPAYAAIRLRLEDSGSTRFALAGLRTALRPGEQERIFARVPGMARVRFARYGLLRRHVRLRDPGIVGPDLAHPRFPGLLLAGSVLGLEGTVESAATGLLAGIQLAIGRKGGMAPLPPDTTALGALARGLGGAEPGRSPGRVAFGQLPSLPSRERGARRDRNLRLSERALRDLVRYASAVDGECAA